MSNTADLKLMYFCARSSQHRRPAFELTKYSNVHQGMNLSTTAQISLREALPFQT